MPPTGGRLSGGFDSGLHPRCCAQRALVRFTILVRLRERVVPVFSGSMEGEPTALCPMADRSTYGRHLAGFCGAGDYERTAFDRDADVFLRAAGILSLVYHFRHVAIPAFSAAGNPAPLHSCERRRHALGRGIANRIPDSSCLDRVHCSSDLLRDEIEEPHGVYDSA